MWDKARRLWRPVRHPIPCLKAIYQTGIEASIHRHKVAFGGESENSVTSKAKWTCRFAGEASRNRVTSASSLEERQSER